MSDQPVPSSPQPPEANGNLSQVIEKVGPIARKVWVTSRPTLAQGLKATIGLLEQASQKLDSQIATDPSDVPPLNLEPLQKASATFWTKTQPLWVKLIAGVRGKLPEDISGKLSDRALSGIVAGMSLLLLTLTTHLPSGSAAPRPVAARPNVAPPPYSRPASRPAVAPTAAQPGVGATAPPPQVPPVTPPPVAPPGIAQTASPNIPQTVPQSFPSALTAPGVTAVPTAGLTATTATATAAMATAPAAGAVAPPPVASAKPVAPIALTASQPVESKPAESKPVPVKKPTAKEKLLAKLQETLGDQGQLIAAVQPNKAAGRLQVSLRPDWYQLDLAQQDQLAQTLFTKAQTLKFRSLELLDGKGEVLARSPVVGNEMVVLVRQPIDAM
jgi:hypothetical protein